MLSILADCCCFVVCFSAESSLVDERFELLKLGLGDFVEVGYESIEVLMISILLGCLAQKTEPPPRKSSTYFLCGGMRGRIMSSIDAFPP